MGKYVFSFTILAIVVLYSVSVDCKHKNKFHHSKNHLKHLHGRNTMDKSVKRDLSKQYAHGYHPELDFNKNIPSIHTIPNLHIQNLNAQETIKTQNGTTNESQDKNQKVISEEIADKSQNKSQENVKLLSLVESKSNASLELKSGGLNVQTAPLGNAAPNEIISNKTAFVSNVLKVDARLEDTVLNQSMIKPVSHSLNVEPLPQRNDSINKTEKNETALFESRGFDVQPVPQINTDLKDFTNNKIAYFKSRSMDVQPIQRSASLNSSTINDSLLENSGSLNNQPSLQGNPALGESMSNNTAPISIA